MSAVPTLRPQSRDKLRACASRHAMREYARILDERGMPADKQEAARIRRQAWTAQVCSMTRGARNCR